MVKFRMSMKGEKGDKPHHISIPQKDAIAIVPPKKVIKALYDYHAPDDKYMSFSQGDFLHVVDREDDQDWYEACNPLQGSRGLVPARYFETVGKNARTSGGSTKSEQTYIPAGNHDSGYGTNSTMSNSTMPNSAARASKSMGRTTGAMVYGMVMYDFVAERPDELDAKEGESIIVIAQSNPEWFVAKPIQRLGGPGLIPVSFIEIRDTVTGQAATDPQEAVRRAGVPKVEEWKKMAADYKNGSIPLGRLEGMAGQMDRMTLNQQPQQQSQNQPPPQSYPSYGNGNGYPQGRTSAGPSSQPSYGNRTSGQGQPQNQPLKAPLQASVPRYCYADDTFWFIVVVEMEDGRWWELQRLYQDFYDLQINLITEFPKEAGNVKGVERSLPYMPGPVTYVTDNISNGRRANLDEYIRSLLKLGPHITRGYRVRKFFAPREGDFELDPTAGDPYRISSGSQIDNANNANNGYKNPAVASQGTGFSGPNPSSTSSNAPMNGAGYPPTALRPGPPSGHMRNMSGNYSGQQGPQGSVGSGVQSGGAGATLVKLKVWIAPDNCIVIRMPIGFNYAELYKKLFDRKQMEPALADGKEIQIFYRDEVDGGQYRLGGDEDLRVAVQRNPKLTLEVRT